MSDDKFPKMFRYKPRQNKLELGDNINGIPILDYVTMLAGMRHTQNEAAALLGVAPATFKRFLANNPEASEAWQDGRQLHKASVRRLVWRHAQSDASTARALAKNLGILKDDKAQGGADGSDQPSRMSRHEAMRRILELQSISQQQKPTGTALARR